MFHHHCSSLLVRTTGTKTNCKEIFIISCSFSRYDYGGASEILLSSM